MQTRPIRISQETRDKVIQAHTHNSQLPKYWQTMSDSDLSALAHNTDDQDDINLIYDEMDKREQKHGFGDNELDSPETCSIVTPCHNCDYCAEYYRNLYMWDDED